MLRAVPSAKIITVSGAGAGGLVGAAVFGVLYAAGRVAGSRSTAFGWYSYTPRRYVDYLPTPAYGAGWTSHWWTWLLVAAGTGVVLGTVLALIAAVFLGGVRGRPRDRGPRVAILDE
jgi:hypothetical protein